MLNAARWSLIGFVAVVAIGCAYDSPPTLVTPTPTPSSAPASIRATASSRSDYTTAVTATVLTSDGRFVAGIPIGFSTANGTVSTAATTTDANGSATTIVTTPANTTVTVTIGAITTTVQVVGAAAPSTGPPSPPIPAPTPPTITPIAIINGPATATTGSPVTFGVSAPANGQTWTWNFGDSTPPSQTTAFTTAHTFNTAGTYPVTVSAPGITAGNSTITVSTAAASAPSTLAATVACTANAHGTASPCNISSVTFGSTAIPSASVTSVSWDWGDGSPAGSGMSASRTYTNAGTYNIVATVNANTSDGPKTVTVPKSITIS